MYAHALLMHHGIATWMHSVAHLDIVPATAKRPGLAEAPSWRFEAAGSRSYGRNDDQGRSWTSRESAAVGVAVSHLEY
jgi:hypothetical protein